MYSTKRAILLLCLAIVFQSALAGAATATQLVGNEVEALETILAYFGMLSLGILGTCLAFVRWFLKRWNPRQLDPETLIFISKLLNDPTMGPMIKDREDMSHKIAEHDKSLKSMADALGRLLGEEMTKPDWDR